MFKSYFFIRYNDPVPYCVMNDESAGIHTARRRCHEYHIPGCPEKKQSGTQPAETEHAAGRKRIDRVCRRHSPFSRKQEGKQGNVLPAGGYRAAGSGCATKDSKGVFVQACPNSYSKGGNNGRSIITGKRAESQRGG